MALNNTVLPLYKANKDRRKVNSSGFSFGSLVLLAPLVLLFFIAGLYVGSRFVQSHVTDTTLPFDNPNIRVQPMPEPVVQQQPPVSEPQKPAQPIDFQPKPDPAGVDKFDVQSNYRTVESTLSKFFSSKTDMYMTAQGSFDQENTVVAAWFYMDPADHTGSMKTVFGNKGPGCEITSAQQGYTVYVNGWETTDQWLYAEWGGQISGCHKISSESAGFKVTPGRWHHVALALGSNSVTLYLNGEQVARKVGIDRSAQQQQLLVVGAHANHQYPFVGRLSNLKVLQCVQEPSEADVQVALDLWGSKTSTSCRLAAHYPLNDFDERSGQSQAIELVSSRHGKYAIKAAPQTGQTAPAANSRGFVDGLPSRALTAELIAESEKLGRERREHVKAAMTHAWDGYKRYAWGKDELKPISNRGQDNWGGLGVTMVDSLSTLWIMGMKDYFWEARDWVRDSLTFDHTGGVSTFETTIRELGGLLAAYDLSGDRAFLDKAIDLGNRLSAAFNTPTGIAKAQVNLRSGGSSNSWAGSSSILAELGTLQIEFCYLSKASGDPSYCEKAMKAFEVLYRNPVPYGLYPTYINPNTGKPANKMVTFGALGDSFYEYLLKVWLQGGRKDSRWREMYDRAMDGVVEKLLQTSNPSHLLYVSDWDGNRNYHKMDHLVCFLPGVLALGAYTDPNGLDSERAQRDLSIAKGLMYTCYQMYARMATGIAPEYVNFVEGKDLVAAPGAPFYILRPETAESLFVLNQLTKEPIYREWSWEIFQAIERHCRTPTAYGSLANVQQVNGRVDDRMESFFLAETLKYLYLAQDPDHPIDLMKYVFNTEAHPTRIFE